MPATVTEYPLGIACVFSDGSRAEFSFDTSANPQLVRDLLAGLVELVHPHGTVDAEGTVVAYALALRNMVTTLAGRGFAGGAGALTRGRLDVYWMGTTANREACTLRMLEAFDTVTCGLAEGCGSSRPVTTTSSVIGRPPTGRWAPASGICVDRGRGVRRSQKPRWRPSAGNIPASAAGRAEPAVAANRTGPVALWARPSTSQSDRRSARRGSAGR
jgi:hypothetical protein